MKINRIFFCTLLALAALSCKKAGGSDNPPAPVVDITPYYLLNEGDDDQLSHAGRTMASVLTPVAGSYTRTTREMTEMDLPVYPRFIKTTDGRYLMFCHCGDYTPPTGSKAESYTWAGSRCSYSESEDGINWKFVKEVFPVQRNVQGQYGKVITRYYAGPHPVRLANGNILVVASYRGSDDMRHHLKDNGLAFKISSDEGRSWSREVRVNVGTNWEPRPIVLRDDSNHPGRVIVYYTDSCPYIDEGIWTSAIISSGVSYIYSDDNGLTWKPDDPLNDHLHAYRQLRDEKSGQKVYTDQMPGVIQLYGSKQLVGCGEANQNPCSTSATDYWVNLAYSDIDGEWGTLSTDGDFPSDRRNKAFKGAAPTIEQFVSGETVLTYNAGSPNVFYYHIGDENARVFQEQKTNFFTYNGTAGRGFWGSVLCDGHILLAGVGGTGGSQGLKFPIQTGLFYLNHDISASSHSVKVDGNNSEWLRSDQALYIGTEAPLKHATLRCSADDSKLYFLVEISCPSGVKDSDYINVFLTRPESDGLQKGDISIKYTVDGELRSSVWTPGWYVQQLPVESAFTKGDGKYIMEFSILKSSLPILSSSIGIDFGISSDEGTRIIKEEGKETIIIKNI